MLKAALSVIVMALMATAVLGGQLEPPDSPTPTMKSQSEIPATWSQRLDSTFFLAAGGPIIPCNSSLPFDGVSIGYIDLTGDILKVRYGFACGCANHKFALCYDDWAFDEEAPEMQLRLAHDDGGEPCYAGCYFTTTWDIEVLRHQYEEMFGQDFGTFTMDLKGKHEVQNWCTTPVDQDTFVSQSKPDDNFGADGLLYLRKESPRRNDAGHAWFGFSASCAGAEPNAAAMKVCATKLSHVAFIPHAYDLLIDEYAITWNDQPTQVPIWSGEIEVVLADQCSEISVAPPMSFQPISYKLHAMEHFDPIDPRVLPSFQQNSYLYAKEYVGPGQALESHLRVHWE